MANRYAVATGNWSSLATWDGGVSLPGASDTVRPNGYTVTIDQNITVTELRGDASSPAVAGGSYLFSAGRTITGNILFTTGGGSLMSLTGTGSSRTITGNITSNVSGTGLYVGSNSDGLTIVGNVLSTGNGNCINGYDRLYLTITGSVTATSTAYAICDQTSAGAVSLSITGDVTSSGSATALFCNTAGTISVTGTVTTGATYGIYSLQAVVIHNGNQIDGTNGHRAIYTPRLWMHQTLQSQYQIRTNNAGVVGALRSLYTGGVNLNQPTTTNVRSGTVYGASSEYTGTLIVPSPTLVAIGVSTDNTVGSYSPSLNAADLRAAVGLASANLDTQLSGINAKTTNLPSDPADASDIAASFTTVNTKLDTIDDFLDTEVVAIKAKTDNLPSDPADQSILLTAIQAVITTAMTESYSADGSSPTLSQAIFLIMQRLTEFSISGTTINIKKLDGTTNAATLTMDSATIPTSSTRSA